MTIAMVVGVAGAIGGAVVAFIVLPRRRRDQAADSEPTPDQEAEAPVG